jgi:hypothetical protein
MTPLEHLGFIKECTLSGEVVNTVNATSKDPN